MRIASNATLLCSQISLPLLADPNNMALTSRSLMLCAAGQLQVKSVVSDGSLVCICRLANCNCCCSRPDAHFAGSDAPSRRQHEQSCRLPLILCSYEDLLILGCASVPRHVLLHAALLDGPERVPVRPAHTTSFSYGMLDRVAQPAT